MNLAEFLITDLEKTVDDLQSQVNALKLLHANYTMDIISTKEAIVLMMEHMLRWHEKGILVFQNQLEIMKASLKG
jgi:hypothetical protein